MTGREILTTIAQLGVAITGFTGIAIAFNRRPARRFFRLHPESFNSRLLVAVTTGHAINGIAQALNALGITTAELSVFIFGLLWILFHSAFQFGRILFVQPETGGAMSRPRPDQDE